MIRILLPVLGVALALGVWIYALSDVVRTDEAAARRLPKALWVTIVLIVPVLGAVAWLLAGRPLPGAPVGGATRYGGSGFVPPEDRPDWPGRSSRSDGQ